MSLEILQHPGNEHLPYSPLAVNTKKMSILNLPTLQFYNFEVTPHSMNLHNCGRTVILNGIWKNSRPYILGSSLNDKYYFSHLHFHWGQDDTSGSEHIINGQRYSMEMHLIFFKGSCQSLFDAELLPDGIITLAYLFETTPKRHEGIQIIVPFLDNVRNFRQTSKILSFQLDQIVETRPCEYFTYWGKMKKINGIDSVSKWIVFTKVLNISVEQVQSFRHFLYKRNFKIKHNCREATFGIETMVFLVLEKQNKPKQIQLVFNTESGEPSHKITEIVKEKSYSKFLNISQEKIEKVSPKDCEYVIEDSSSMNTNLYLVQSTQRDTVPLENSSADKWNLPLFEDQNLNDRWKNLKSFHEVVSYTGFPFGDMNMSNVKMTQFNNIDYKIENTFVIQDQTLNLRQFNSDVKVPSNIDVHELKCTPTIFDEQKIEINKNSKFKNLEKIKVKITKPHQLKQKFLQSKSINSKISKPLATGVTDKYSKKIKKKPWK